MKYIDKFATLDDFLASSLSQMSGDRIATIEGYELPILKKKMKTVITIDPSTNQEVETEELQDVWMVPVGQEEKKVEHNFEVLPYKKIFYFSSGSGVKDYSLAFTPLEINNVFKDNNVSLGLSYSKVTQGRYWGASDIGTNFSVEKFGDTYTILYSNLKTAVYPTDGQTVDIPFFLQYDGNWKEFKCHATFEEFDISNVVLNNHMTLTPSSTIEIGSIVAVGNNKIVKSTGNNDIDKFYVTDVSVSTVQGNDSLTYNSQYITIPNTQYSSGYDIEGTIHLTPYILDDAINGDGGAVEGNNITMPLSLHLNVKANGDIPFEFESFDASVTYSNTVEPNEQIIFELDLNETYDRDLTSYTVTGNSNYISYSGTTGGKVNVTMTVPSDLTAGSQTITDTIRISNSRGYSFDFAVTYSIEVAQPCQEYLDFGNLENDNNTYGASLPNTSNPMVLPSGIVLGCAGTSVSNIYDDDIEFVSAQCYNLTNSEYEQDSNLNYYVDDGNPWNFYINPPVSGSGNYRYDLTFRLKSDNSIVGIWSFNFEWYPCSSGISQYSKELYKVPTTGTYGLYSSIEIGQEYCSSAIVTVGDFTISQYTLYEVNENDWSTTQVSDPNITFSITQNNSEPAYTVSWTGLDNEKRYMADINFVGNGGGTYDGLSFFMQFSLVTKPALTEPTVTISSNEPDRTQDGEGYRGNTTIQEVVVSSGVTSLGESCFNSCYNLTEVTLPNTLEYLGTGAFLGTGIYSISLPNSLLGADSNHIGELGYGTFMNCQALTSINIPDGISHIASSCFANCINLAHIELPYGCTYESNSFDGCPAANNITYRQAPSGGEPAGEGGEPA